MTRKRPSAEPTADDWHDHQRRMGQLESLTVLLVLAVEADEGIGRDSCLAPVLSLAMDLAEQCHDDLKRLLSHAG